MKNSTLDRYKDTDLGSFCQKRAESEPSKPEVGPPSQTGTPRDLNGNQGETLSGPAQPPTPPPTPTSPDYNSPTTTAPENDAQYRETLQEFKEKHRGIYSTPPIDLPLHFRAMLRLGRKWWGVPDRHCTGFKFYDPTSKFSNIEKAGCFIHLYRQRRIEIHSCMRRQFFNLLAPLKAYGAKWNVRRVKVDRHYVEIIEVVCGWYCVLVALRNWCNPLFEEEVARIVKAFSTYTRDNYTERQYKVVWKCVIAPAFEDGQTKMERYWDFLHFFRMPYVFPPGLLDSIARQAGIDYRHAYPSEAQWTTGAVDCLRGKMCLFLGQEPTAAIDATEYRRMLDLVSRAHAPRQHEPPPFRTGSDFAPSPATTYSHIDTIMKPASKSSSLPMSGLDPPWAQRFPPSNPSRPILSPPVPKRTASPRPSTLGEKEEAQLKVWVHDARIITNRYYRINFIRCVIIRNLALQISPQHVTTLIRAIIRKAWGLNRRTTLEYCNIAYSMLHDNENEETYKIRKVTNTRRKRIRHLYMKLLWDKNLQTNPSKLVQYAMRLWGVRRRSAWEYEQAAWIAFNRKEDFLDEAPASHLKTTYRTIHLCDLARNNPALAQEPIKLILKAMSLWGIQRRTAGILVNRVTTMLHSSPKEASQ